MSMSWLFFSPQGRINRSVWWMVIGATLFLDLGVYMLASSWQSSTLTIVVGLIAFGLRIAPSVKRLHDRNKSGFWVLLYFGAPYALSLYVLSQLPSDEAALVAIDVGLANTIALIGLVMLGILAWVIVDLGIAEGTRGDNKYGPDPLAGRRPGGMI